MEPSCPIVVASLHSESGEPGQPVGDRLGIAQIPEGRQRLQHGGLPLIESPEPDQSRAERHQRVGRPDLGARCPVEREGLLEDAASVFESLLVDVEDPEVVEPDRDPSLVAEVAVPGETLGDQLSGARQIAE